MKQKRTAKKSGSRGARNIPLGPFIGPLTQGQIARRDRDAKMKQLRTMGFVCKKVDGTTDKIDIDYHPEEGEVVPGVRAAECILGMFGRVYRRLPSSVATSEVLQKAIGELAKQSITVRLIKYYQDVKKTGSQKPIIRNAANATYPRVGMKPPKNGYVELEIRGINVEEIKDAMRIMDHIVETIIDKARKK